MTTTKSRDLPETRAFLDNLSPCHLGPTTSGESLGDGDEDDVEKEQEEQVDPKVLGVAEVEHREAAGKPRNSMERQLKPSCTDCLRQLEPSDYL